MEVKGMRDSAAVMNRFLRNVYDLIANRFLAHTTLSSLPVSLDSSVQLWWPSLPGWERATQGLAGLTVLRSVEL